MRSDRRPRFRRAVRSRPGRGPVVCLALLAALALGACGSIDSSSKTYTPFGAGSGGTAVNTAAATTIDIPNLVGGTQGQLSYDTSYFVYTPQTPTASNSKAGLLVTPAGDLGLQLSVILGRPDTPCRFQAALAARDDGYIISGNGEDRVNDQQVDFHEVLLHSSTQYWRLDCAQLTGNVGVQVLTVSAPTDERNTAQVVYVLNSIHH